MQLDIVQNLLKEVVHSTQIWLEKKDAAEPCTYRKLRHWCIYLETFLLRFSQTQVLDISATDKCLESFERICL